MNVCIDALPLLDRRGTGVYEYTRHLLDALFEFSPDQFFLYSNSYQYRQNLRESWREKKNIRIFETRIPNKILNPCQAFLRWPKLDKILSRAGIRPDLYYFPNLDFFVFGEPAPYILTVHDLSFEICPNWFSPKKRLWHKMINPRAKALGAAKVIAISESTKRDLINIYGVPPEKIAVIYPGLNDLQDGISAADMRLRHFLPENFILFMGTVEKRKNVLGLIRAFEIIAPKLKDFSLILAGSPGCGFGEIWAAAKTSKFKDRIIFFDYVPAEERQALYAAAKLFVYPSFYEGFGMPPLEAMSLGVPVVTSLASSLGEVVGDAALMVNPHHMSELAEAMLEGITNDRLRKSLILRGYEQVKKFSWDKAAGELNGIFQEII